VAALGGGGRCEAGPTHEILRKDMGRIRQRRVASYRGWGGGGGTSQTGDAAGGTSRKVKKEGNVCPSPLLHPSKRKTQATARDNEANAPGKQKKKKKKLKKDNP